MKKAKIVESFEEYLNLNSRLEFLENLLKVNSQNDCTGLVLNSNFSKEKCKSSYSKSEVALFFYILMDEGIFFFDKEDKRNNRSKFQHFLSNNFTYAGDHGSQIMIKSISKQFSESKGFVYREKQIKFLEELLERLHERKRRIANW